MINIFRILKERKRFILFALLKVLVMILGLITNIFIARKLSVNDFGIFSVAFMLIGLITTFGFNWSSSSILYYGSKEKEKYGTINKTFWSRNIIILFSLIIVTMMFGIFRTQINQYVGLKISFLILLWLYVSVFEDYLSQYFLAVKNQLLSSLLSVTAKIIYLLLILFFNFDIRTLIVLNIISHSTVLLYTFGINKRDIGKFEFDKDWFKEVLSFSLWQLFGFSGLYLINFGDTAVIKHFMTNVDVGVYNVAYKLFNNIAGFGFVISSYYAASVSTYFLNKDYDKIYKFFYKERVYIIILSTIGHLVLIAFSKPIITALYGPKYTDAVLIFNILMVGSVFKYLTVFYMMYYNTNRKFRLQQTINIFRAVLNLILDVIFIKYWGLIGPAIATTVAIVITSMFSMFYCEKRIRLLSRSQEYL